MNEPPEVTDDNVIEVVDPRDKTTALLLNEQALREDGGGCRRPSHDATDAKTKADARYRKLQQTTVKMKFKGAGRPVVQREVRVPLRGASTGAKAVQAPERQLLLRQGRHARVTPGSKHDGDRGHLRRQQRRREEVGAKVNEQKPPDTGSDATSTDEAQHQLEEIEVVDPRDKTTSGHYR